MDLLTPEIRARLEEQGRAIDELRKAGHSYGHLPPLAKLSGTFEGRRLVFLLRSIQPDDTDFAIACVDMGNGDLGMTQISLTALAKMCEEFKIVLTLDNAFSTGRSIDDYHLAATRAGRIED